MNTLNQDAHLANQQLLFKDIVLAQNGDHQAFARIIDQTRNLVSSIALSIVKDLDSSEDVAQQVFIGAWNNLSELKKTSSFLPWLRQMTRYKALNFLRDNKVSKKLEGEEADLILSQFCDPTLDMDSHLQREQSNVILQNFINQLPDESREIVLLYYREEQSSQHVAHLLEQSETNIRKKLSRVRQLLQTQILQKHGRLLLSTAPALGFSSLILAAITTSTPAAAAAISSAAGSAKSGLMHKLGLLLSGSFIGALVAVFAVRLSTIPLLKKLTNQQSIQQVLNYRKTMTFWIIFGGVLLAIGYEFTQGWWGPVSAYGIFAAGIMYQMNTMQKLIAREFYSQDDMAKNKRTNQKLQYFCGWFGSVLGVATGFACLVFDLISDGRM
ncbi:sigma-70 family RNA polymerase sigma factor [uncultured Paraglaciecola sp.]|uniref:RNA polymerase sigma factor n=1 Tax=uncultured Paraglaciecola sp. TaxID=1765024 RepID=UPI00260F6792|nr:sigma-70 family RNA polymerase sigma factor [uncultured Paraglaciecola sp.]